MIDKFEIIEFKTTGIVSNIQYSIFFWLIKYYLKYLKES